MTIPIASRFLFNKYNKRIILKMKFYIYVYISGVGNKNFTYMIV